ncbi:MAG: DNA-directed RNA polymerase subunit alpha [Dehalococcoidia bacterium]|nr:DNA-directed RNA polymerase subunit alpha [Dehalococcoidia bacterium]MSQ17616.1 DNA-directed RNA polymerase subunit alpha [Dehalococcoidia bacterium]
MLETFIIPSGPNDGVAEPIKPELRVLTATEVYCKVAMEPLQRGFGITVGNPLRRVLLSSIKGSAITWVKIEDSVHEYTTIRGVKEEVMELLLNIKRIRIRSQAARTGRVRLEVSGEGRVCAGDIATSADFEIINPELHLATLDTKESRLSIEFNVEQGLGYQPATLSENTASTLPVGVLPVDAIFNPIRKVDYAIERTRVGQVTDYERLVLEVWTDGTISPLEAVREAANTLVNHNFIFSKLNVQTEASVKAPTIMVSPEIYQTPIDKLGLSPRTLNCLKRAHIGKVGEVLEMSNEDLLKIRNFGEKSLEELQRKLSELGVEQQPGVSIAVAETATVAVSDEADETPEAEPEKEPDDKPDQPIAGLESLGAALRSASRRRSRAAPKEEA